MDSVLDQVYWGNTVRAYLMVCAWIFITWAIIRILRRIVLAKVGKWISKTDTIYDDVLLSVVQNYVLPYVYLLINYQIIQGLYIKANVQKVLAVAMAVITTYFVVRLINHVLQLMVNGFMRKRKESGDRIRQLSGVLFVIKALMWLVGLIFSWAPLFLLLWKPFHHHRFQQVPLQLHLM